MKKIIQYLLKYVKYTSKYIKYAPKYIMYILLLLFGIWIGKTVFKRTIYQPYPSVVVKTDTIRISSKRDTVTYYSPITTVVRPIYVQPTIEEVNTESLLYIYKIEYKGKSIDAKDLYIYTTKDGHTNMIKYSNVRSPFLIASRTNDVLVRSQRAFPYWQKLGLDLSISLYPVTQFDYAEVFTRLNWQYFLVKLYLKVDYNKNITTGFGFSFIF